MDEFSRQRRVYRLLAMLSGRPIAAAEALKKGLPARIPDGPRGERIAVHLARTLEPGRLSLLAEPYAEQLASLDHPEREAWVLRRGLGFTERDAAIALDCSRTVLRRRLESVDDRLDSGAVRAVRSTMLNIGLPVEAIRTRHARQRRWRWFGLIILFVMVVVGLDLLRNCLDQPDVVI